MRSVSLAALFVLTALGVVTALASGATAPACPVTVPGEAAPPSGFNYGTDRLRVGMYWQGGVLTVGVLPEGGSMARIDRDRLIRAKVGWWRKRGNLAITGRRLDGPAPPLRASVLPFYGDSGFQPTSLLFPTFGCWRVVGRAGGARLAFVVNVRKHKLLPVRFARFQVNVSNAWYWRSLRGPSGRILQVSNASFRIPGGGDPIKEARDGTFHVTLLPLGNNGSPSSPTITPGDFLAKNDPRRPQGRAVANHSYCSPAGPCLSISLIYKGDRVPDRTLAAVNTMLRSLSATRP